MNPTDTALTDIYATDLVKTDSWLVPPVNGHPRDISKMRDSVSRWLDHLGEKSSKAQGLKKQLTTAEKFKRADDQQLYFFIEREANNGRGAMLGFLRTGQKNLFFHMNTGEIIQKAPVCVLDFYVVEEYQRRGVGKMLYDFMLKDKNLSPHMLAIDRPSEKMLAFLAKYYAQKDMRVHANNYAVSPQFFNGYTEKMATAVEPNMLVGRYTARRPISQMDSIIHGVRL